MTGLFPIANDTVIELHENRREYIFKDREIVIEDVRELIIRPSGTHRVKTEDGALYIINPEWYAIMIIDESKKDWTV